MENASKALIIAGAILISILLISVGIMVFNAISQPAGEAANMGASLAAQSFNGQFDKYFGDNRPADTARAVMKAVNANNRTNDTKVTIVGAGTVAITGTTATTFSAGTTVVNSGTYYIKDTAWSPAGYITQITISTAAISDKQD